MGVAADMAGRGEGASADTGSEGHLMRLRGTSMPARHRGQHRPGPMETGCSSGGRNVWLGPGATGTETLEQRARGGVAAEGAGVWG